MYLHDFMSLLRGQIIKNETIDKEIIDMIGQNIEGFMRGSSSSGNMRPLQGEQHVISYFIVEKANKDFNWIAK